MGRREAGVVDWVILGVTPFFPVAQAIHGALVGNWRGELEVAVFSAVMACVVSGALNVVFW
jgi:hypothetical protein